MKPYHPVYPQYRPRVGDRVYLRVGNKMEFLDNNTGVIYYQQRRTVAGIGMTIYRIGLDWKEHISFIHTEHEIKFKHICTDEELLTHVCQKVRNIVLKNRRKSV